MGITVIGAECVVITFAGVGLWLAFLARYLGRRRPGFAVAAPFVVGYVVRVLVIPAISLTGVGRSLRGGDELIFMGWAHALAAQPFTSSQWLPWNHSSFLHVIVFALQLKTLGSPEGALRIAQVGIAMTGVMLIVASVYDLGGSGPARLAAWLLNLEIASIFFNELIHKDPLMELSSGLVILGATKVWRAVRPGGVALMAIGALIALGTRNYVGYFLFACAVMIALHAMMRHVSGHLGTIPALLAIAGALAAGAPAVLAATSSQNLKGLQHSQQTNATTTNGNGATDGNNLALEQVDFSSRWGIVTNLPERIRDLMLRPYPWQVADVNQIVGVVGSLIALACWFLMLRWGWKLRGEVMDRAGPLVYPFVFLMIAYALAVGNAGTGFRYRTHLVTIGLAIVALLRPGILQRRARASLTETDLRAGTTPTGGPIEHPPVPAPAAA